MTEIDRLNAYRRERREAARELTSAQLLSDLLEYDDGYAGRARRATSDELDVVRLWLRTPRGQELDRRLWRPEQLLDPDPLDVTSSPGPDADLLGSLRHDRHFTERVDLAVHVGIAVVLVILVVVFVLVSGRG